MTNQTIMVTLSARFREVVTDLPEIIECHAITGVESYILKVAMPNVAHLEGWLWKLKDYDEVRTSLVLSTQLARRSINPRLFEDKGKRLRLTGEALHSARLRHAFRWSSTTLTLTLRQRLCWMLRKSSVHSVTISP